MKKLLFSSLAVVTLAMVGCSEENEQLMNNNTNEVFSAEIITTNSRTSLGENGKMLWSEGDAINLFKKAGYYEKRVVDKGGSSSATFSYGGVTVTGAELDQHYAVYPYAESNSISGTTISVDLSKLANQTYTENSFDPTMAVMVAKSTTTELPFKNTLSIAKVDLNIEAPIIDATVSSIKFTSTNAALTGTATIDMSEDKQPAVITGEGKEITLTANNVVLSSDYTPFYIMLPAQEFDKDELVLNINAKVNNEEKNYEIKLPAVVFKRSSIITFTKTIREEDEWTGSTDGDEQVNATSVSSVEELQAAINGATDGTTIVLADDITGDVTISQKDGVNITIDGNNRTFTGLMTTFGSGRQSGTETLTIKNINFVAGSGKSSCIYSPDKSETNSYSYSHNVTVENCTFTDGDGTVNCAAIRHGDGGDKNWTITNCKVDNTMHSLLQINNVAGKLTVAECTVESKNGINLNSCTNVEVSGCDFDVTGYAVRFGVSSGGNLGETKTFAISESTLKSACDDNDAIIMFRASAVDATLTLTDVTFDGTTEISGNTEATTIIIDGKQQVATAEQLATAITNGVENIELSAGTYTLPTAAAGKTLTISGTKETKISVISGLTYANGANVTFEGVTIQSDPEGAGYTNGFADFKYATFNECVINGTLGLYFSCEFNNCEFNIEGNYYNVWTWGAGTATFKGCTFNCDGKALLVYANVLDNGTNHQTVNITGCTFNDNGDDTVTGKAAIEITNTYTPIRTYDVIIKNTTVKGFAETVPGSNDFNATCGSVENGNIGTNVWGNKCKLSADYLNVEIDGVDVY